MRRRPGRHGSIRFRITVVATALVAVVLVAASVVLVLVQRQQLFDNLDSSLDQRADLIEAEITADPASDVGFANSNVEDRFAQLVDSGGEVIRVTENLRGVAPVAPAPPGRQSVDTVDSLPIEDDSYRVLSRRVDGPDAAMTLHVGQNVDDLNENVRLLATSLAVAVPTLVGVLCLLVWSLVGRTLRPVEKIRTEVAAIGAADLDRRVAELGSDDEIARLATTMNEMLDRLAEATRRQQRFVADASHELRTPLTRMRTELEVDLVDEGRADPSATHRSVLEEVAEMQLLTEDLLYLARSDAGAAFHRREPVDLDDVVTREVQQLRVESTIDIDMSGVLGAGVIGDVDQLRRAARNLLHNATRHATGRVVVGLREAGDFVVLTVDDDGPGIPEAHRDQVFERFTLIDPARSAIVGGTGLGLAIARDIVERHGGIVLVESGPLGGARFVVRLPTA